MIKINLSEDRVLDLLMKRFCDFTGLGEDTEEYKLFEKMYQNYIDNGIFESMEEFDPMVIVDNDYINNYTVCYKDNTHYHKIKKLYKKNGLCDISCKSWGYSAIVAASDDEKLFLLRY